MIKLSVLIPSIPERFYLLNELYRKLSSEHVEVLCLADNKIMSIGEKRDKLLTLAKGRYITFVDDDDMVSDDYISSILEVVDNNDIDLITFLQRANISGVTSTIDFDIAHEKNEEFHEGTVNRRPFHVCVWKRAKVKHIRFPHINYGEDSAWSEQACLEVSSQIKINKVLHFYTYDSNITRAFSE